MNKIGYDAMAIGNHEFDKPQSVLRQQQKLANFEFVNANIKTTDGKQVFKPYITRIVDGKKIAIIGYTTPDIPKMSPKANLTGLVFEEPFASTRALVQQLKKDHDFVIALSHLGYYANESHGLDFPGDETLAKKIPELDMIIGGHTHSELQKPVKIGNTYIVQANSGGQFVGRMDIDLSLLGDKMTDYKLVPVKGFAQDQAILDITKPYLVEAKNKLGSKVGHTVSEFKGGRGFVEVAEQPIGKMVAAAHKQKVSADLSFVHSKRIRAGLPKGDISLRDLLNISPFGNTLTTAELNGQELWKAVETMHHNFTAQNDMAYFSDNLVLTIKDKKIVKIHLDGKMISMTATGKYKVVMNNFLSEIMPEFDFIKQHPSFENTGIKDVEALENYFKQHNTLDPRAFIRKSYASEKICNQPLTVILKTLIPLKK
ncbi:MAG: 5'-nucleotidase C-terminal domain-containing protein [Bdellovibrionales bacterium]|nr:5'-nucleotidase C-terminal domain-containing protein [Bdellovibrionales bacterium]